MKIIKSTEKEKCKAMVKVDKKEEVPHGSKISGIIAYLNENRRRVAVIACSVLLIGVAIFLNWKLFGSSADTPANAPLTTEPASTGVPSVSDGETSETYFALAVIERQRARNEALQVLQNLVDGDDTSSDEKSVAEASISRIATDIEREANIETLLRAKGFTDCLALIDGNKVNIIIGTSETLLANQIAQITEIAYTSAGIVPDNLTISEKK